MIYFKISWHFSIPLLGLLLLWYICPKMFFAGKSCLASIQSMVSSKYWNTSVQSSHSSGFHPVVGNYGKLHHTGTNWWCKDNNCRVQISGRNGLFSPGKSHDVDNNCRFQDKMDQVDHLSLLILLLHRSLFRVRLRIPNKVRKNKVQEKYLQ